MGRRPKITRHFCTLLTGAVIAVLAVSGVSAAEQAALPRPPSHFMVEAGARSLNQPPRPSDAPGSSNWWYYDVILRETSGRTGITLSGWTKCYTTKDDTGCEKVRNNFQHLFATDRIPPGGTLKLKKPAWVWADKNGDTFKVEATYWGRDDDGNEVKSGYRFTIKSD